MNAGIARVCQKADKSAVGTINRPLRGAVPVRDIPSILLNFITGWEANGRPLASLFHRGLPSKDWHSHPVNENGSSCAVMINSSRREFTCSLTVDLVVGDIAGTVLVGCFVQFLVVA